MLPVFENVLMGEQEKLLGKPEAQLSEGMVFDFESRGQETEFDFESTQPIEYTFIPSERSQPYMKSISAAEQQYGLPKNMLARVIETESRFDPNARSPVGATGIAQIMPEYHPGVDPTDPIASIDYSAKYLKKLYDRFGDWDKALAAYNAGPTRVAEGGDLPEETRNYLEKINLHKVSGKPAGEFEFDFESPKPITIGREPGIYQAPEPEEKSLIGRAWEGVLKAVRDDEAEKIKSANAVAMAESLGISPSEAYDNLDALSKEVGLRGQPTWQELVEGTAMGGVVVGLLANPLTTIVGVGIFMGLAEIENALVSLQPDEEYEFGTMKGLQELLPEDTSQKIKDLVWTVDMAWKVAVAGGIGKTVSPMVHKGTQALYTKFVRDVSAKYNLPKDVYISPDKIREFHGKGREDVISRAESDMLKGLGITRQQYKDALKQGIDIRIPSEKIITAVDKPWWATFKRILGARPYRMEFVKRAGEPTIKKHTELLAPPLRGIPKRPVKPSDAVPEQEFVSKKGHVYEKIGDKWYGSKGREVTNKFIIRAAEKGKVETLGYKPGEIIDTFAERDWAVRLKDGKIVTDKKAVNHPHLIEKLGIDPVDVADTGFVIKGKFASWKDLRLSREAELKAIKDRSIIEPTVEEPVDLQTVRLTKGIEKVVRDIESGDITKVALDSVRKGIDLAKKNPEKYGEWPVAHWKTTLPIVEEFGTLADRADILNSADYVIRTSKDKDLVGAAKLVKMRLGKPEVVKPRIKEPITEPELQAVEEPKIKIIGKHHSKVDMIPGRHKLLEDKKGNTYESDEFLHALMLEEFKLTSEDIINRGWKEADGSVTWLDAPDLKMDLIEPSVGEIALAEKLKEPLTEPTIPPEESQFRQDPELTKRTLDLLPEYGKIDTPEQLFTRITNEINSELDGKLDASPTRRLLNDLSEQAKIWALGEEPPAGIFEGMSFEELGNMSDYLGRLDEWAKQTDRLKIEQTLEPEVVYGKYLERSDAMEGDAWLNEFRKSEKYAKTMRDAKEGLAEVEARLGPLADKKIEFIHHIRKTYDLTLEKAKEIADGFYSGKLSVDDVKARLAKPVEEPDVTLGMGAQIQDLYDKLTTSKKPKKVKLPEKSPKPFTEVKEEARELVRERRSRLDLLNYDVNKFVNKLEYGYSEKQLEAAYFAIEKTKVPAKLNRPDLEKVLSKDKKILDDIAKQSKSFHDKQWKEIKKVWPDLTTKQIEDYITHLYDIPKHRRAEAANWFSTFASSLEPRHIPTMEMAIEQGFIPKTLNVAEIIKINSAVINRAIANTEYIESLLAMEKEGIPLIQRGDKAPLDWIEVDYRALTRRIPLPKKEAKKKGEFVKESRVRVHPDLVRPLKVIFEARFDHPIVSAYEAINGVMKKAKLSLQLFHHGALFETGVALMGLLKTLNIYFNPVKIYKGLVRGELDVFAKEAIARDSIVNGGVQYGATADIPIARIQGYFNDLARVSRDTPIANRITSLLKDANSVWDKALWSYLHDTLKLYGYESLVGKLDPKMNAEMTRKAKREIGQFVNDTFGGQNWDTLMMTPKEVQMLTWGLLSADWTVSTTRQALALTGIGNVYKETKGLRRAMGWKFWARAGLYFGIGMNLLNVMNRKKDMEENPQYYEDKDYSFFDKTMFGNTMGKKTYLFDGRYEDGTERYIRWGKQFRDFFELLINPLKKIGGKVSPLPQLISEIATGHTLSGFKNDDIYGTEGLEKAKGILKTIVKSGLPISVIRYMREDMEFKPLDIMMQSSKGMSRYSSMEYFKKAIIEGDEEALRDTYVAAFRNNLPAYTLFTSALSWAEAEATASLSETLRDIEDARVNLYVAESANEKKRYGKILGRLNKEKADKSIGLKLFKAAVERARVYKDMELREGPSLP